MLQKDLTKSIHEQCSKFLDDITHKASAAGLHWVVCFWLSPLSKQCVDRRVGYFEDITEAEHMQRYLHDVYAKRFNFKFYIITSYGSIEDGGIFDA